MEELCLKDFNSYEDHLFKNFNVNNYKRIKLKI